ncbi:hypothetical protein ACF073_07335 [Streptomyces sp. NPDC015171]|uniref:hypothetical protein n=1 Tax=Streptomyces sp. NPDC015171 TaxID=3364945 RepID=UPI0036FB1B5B
MVHETGEAFTIKQLRRRAYWLMEVLGLRRVRLDDARASCLTFLANNGVPDHILAGWAGHTNVKTTKKWCVKPDVEDLREAATTWGGLPGEVNGRACGRRRYPRGGHQVLVGLIRTVPRCFVPPFGTAPHALLQTRNGWRQC